MHLQGEKLGEIKNSSGSFFKKILRLSFILILDVVAVKGEQYHNQKNYYIDIGIIVSSININESYMIYRKKHN